MSAIQTIHDTLLLKYSDVQLYNSSSLSWLWGIVAPSNESGSSTSVKVRVRIDGESLGFRTVISTCHPAKDTRRISDFINDLVDLYEEYLEDIKREGLG